MTPSDPRLEMFLRTAVVALVATLASAVPALAQSASTFSFRSIGLLPDVAPDSPLRVATPRDGATVGSPTIDVRGHLRGVLNDPGTVVLVNGQAALVEPRSGRSGRFLLANLELSNGPNALTITAIAPGGAVYETTRSVTLARLTSNNAVVQGRYAYAARGTAGLGVMNLVTREFTTVAAPGSANRIDDVAVADGLLFVLDAAFGGHLAVYSLADPAAPALVSGPVTVPVGPFAGVSAGGGRVVVSGGTSLLTVRSYSPNGQLGSDVASIDLGVGQPDVLVSPDGARAFVSTDFSGTVGGATFGVTTIALNAPPSILSRTGLPGAGFTSGFQGPANFPIESALVNGALVTAHGGGLSRIDTNGALLGTTPLGFPAVNVDADGDRVFVVGTGRRLVELDLSTGVPQTVETTTFPGPGAFTGVAADDRFVVVAAGSGGLRVVRR